VRLHPNLVKFLLLSEDEPSEPIGKRLRIEPTICTLPTGSVDQNDLGTRYLATHEKLNFPAASPHQVMVLALEL